MSMCYILLIWKVWCTHVVGTLSLSEAHQAGMAAARHPCTAPHSDTAPVQLTWLKSKRCAYALIKYFMGKSWQTVCPLASLSGEVRHSSGPVLGGHMVTVLSYSPTYTKSTTVTKKEMQSLYLPNKTAPAKGYTEQRKYWTSKSLIII